MEVQVLGADAGARVRGAWKRGEAAHRVWEGGAAGMLYGVRVSRRKNVLTRGNG